MLQMISTSIVWQITFSKHYLMIVGLRGCRCDRCLALAGELSCLTILAEISLLESLGWILFHWNLLANPPGRLS